MIGKSSSGMESVVPSGNVMLNLRDLRGLPRTRDVGLPFLNALGQLLDGKRLVKVLHQLVSVFAKSEQLFM